MGSLSQKKAYKGDNLFEGDYKREWVVGKTISRNGVIKSSNHMKKFNRLTKTLERMPNFKDFKEMDSKVLSKF